MKREVQFRDLGVLDYQTVWDLQHDLFQQTIDTKIHNRRNQTKTFTTNYFLLVEHNPVITLGKSGSADHLLTSQAELEAQGVSFLKSIEVGILPIMALVKSLAIPFLIWIIFLPISTSICVCWSKSLSTP